MKKFLLSLAAVALAGAASAETVTFDFVNEDYGLERGATTYVSDATLNDAPVSLQLKKVEGNGYRLWSDGLRIYKGKTEMTISVQDAVITEVKIKGAKTLGASIDFAGTAVAGDENVYTYSPKVPAESVLATFTPTANNALATLTVTYEVASTDDRKPAGLAFPEDTYYIGSNQKYFSNATLTNPNNLPVTYTSSDEAVASVTEYGIQINGVGETKITASFEGNDEYRQGSASYTLSVLPPVNSIAEMVKLANKSQFLVSCELMIGFKNINNLFVTDGEDWIQIYGANEYISGDLIPAGWASSYELYNGNTPELLPISALPASPANVGNNIEFPTLGVPTVGDVNKVAYFHVTFNEATPSAKETFTGLINGTEVAFYNNYSTEGVEAGEYDMVKCVVRVAKDGAVSLYPISYEKAPAEPELEYPELLDVTVSSTGLDVAITPGKVVITGETENDEVTSVKVTLAVPEGWDGWLVSGDFSSVDTTPIAKVAPAMWVPVAEVLPYGYKKANSFNVDADNIKNYIEAYLYKGDMADMANGYEIEVKVKKGLPTSVEEIEVATEDAEYYTLQGVKVANPENGVYVKVCGGKAEKVVIK